MIYFKNLNTSKKIFLVFIIFLFIILMFITFFGHFILPYDPYVADSKEILSLPSSEHIMGFDHLGRDLFSRVITGIQSSMIMSIIVIIINFFIGTTLGIIAGYYGNITKTIIMRITDMFLAFPGMILSIAVVGVLGQGTFNTIVALLISGWSVFARMALSLTIEQKDKDYMITSIFHGCSKIQIIFKYIFLNILPQMIVFSVLNLSTTIIRFSSLAFLGLGFKPPRAELGLMLFESKKYMQLAPHYMIFSGIALFIIVFTFNFLSDFITDYIEFKSEVD